MTLLAMVGARESEIPVLAELHRNPQVHLVGVYDPDPAAIGHEMAEILGLRHGSTPAFLEQIAAAGAVVLSQERERIQPAVEALKERGARFLNSQEALELYGGPHWGGLRRRAARNAREGLQELEEAVRWLDRALDREEVLRGLLSLLLQAVDADNGSIQLVNHATKELYIAWAEGLSDHTIRSSRRRLGEGISGRVALARRGEIIEGQPTAPSQRDRAEIQSAICVPLQDGDTLLGVANVSRDRGGESFQREDLLTVERVASRIAPVLARLLEIQTYHERALVGDLERGLERLLLMDLDLPAALGMVRDLLHDLSGAEACSLMVLPPDGLAVRIQAPGRAGGEARLSRDVDPRSGILGQVLLTQEIVILEERVRPAGQATPRRYSTLYVPLGSPEPFAVFVAEFEGLASLSHFQRNLNRVQAVVTPRLGSLLARHESRSRLERLERLARDLSALAARPRAERPSAAAESLAGLTGAEGVAVWDGPGPEPSAVVGEAGLPPERRAPLWAALRRRLEEDGEVRLREVEPDDQGLRSLLLVGRGDGAALAAWNRRPLDPLEEEGFRGEDLEAAALLVAGLRGPAEPAPAAAPRDEAVEDDFTTNRYLLREAVERELERAQRYHFAFSLTCFQLPPEQASNGLGPRLRDLVRRSARATDCVLWIGPGRFAVLAPEEARGQRKLARRYRQLLDACLREGAPEAAQALRLGHALYPQDADGVDEMLRQAQEGLGPTPD